MTRADRGRRAAASAFALLLGLALASPVAAQWRGEGRQEARGGGRGAPYQDRGERRVEPRGGGGWGGGGWNGGGERRSYGGRGEIGPAFSGAGYRPQPYGGYGGGYGSVQPGARPAGATRAWRRGETLPDGYRGATVPDPGRYHLRRPPNGYDWVGDNRNAYLMQRSTGMVLDSVPGAYEPPPPYRGRRR